MGRIQSSVGLVTGIEIEATVNQLMELAAQPRETLASRQKVLQAEQTALTDLTGLTLGVQLAIKRFKDANLFGRRSVASSNPALLTATASTKVPVGQYQFIPFRTAQTHQVISSGIATRDEPLGEGSLTFRFGGQVNQGIRLDDLNAGAGVARGKIKITDRSGASAVIDLRAAQTIDDVIAAINASEDIEVEAVADGDRLRLIDGSGGTTNLRVQEVAGGTTAADLGLGGINVAANEATGLDIVSLFDGLQLSQLNGGNGVSLRPELAELEITFRDGSAPLSIDLDPTGEDAPKTLGEVIDRINAADPTRLQAAISADGERIVLTDLTTGGGTFGVTSPFNGDVAAELGLTTAASGGTITGSRILSGLKTTLVSTLAGGNGLGSLGNLTLTDRSGATATVNLAGAETLDEIIAEINSAGLGLRAEYNSARTGLQLVDTTGATTSNLIAADGDATNTATKLGLVGNVAAGQINGTSLSRQVVSRSTLLSSYNAGKGIGTGSFLITDSNGSSASINLKNLDAETVGDAIDAINGLSIGVEARINDAGDGIVLVDTAGGDGELTVGDVGSGTVARDLHIAGTAEDGEIDGTTTFTIEITDSDTLDDVIEKINGLNAGVTAGVISQGSGSLPHHLTLLSNTAGKAGELVIDGTGAGLAFQDLSSAQDAVLQFGTGLAATLFTSTNNQFKGVIDGLDVTTNGSSSDPVAIQVAATGEASAEAIQTFVDNYNKLRDKLKTYTAYDPAAGTKGTLFGSAETLRIDTEVSGLLTARYFGVGDVQSLGELGVAIDDQGKLTFDKSKFLTRYASDPEAVVEFFTNEDLGFAVKADAVLERLVGRDNSALVSRSLALARQVDDTTERVTIWDQRLERQRERLLNQFYNLELVVSRIRNNLTSINQIQALTPYTGSSS